MKALSATADISTQSHISTKADLTSEIPEYANNIFAQKVKISMTFPLTLLCSNGRRFNRLECRRLEGVAVVYAGLVFAVRATQAVSEIRLPWDFNGRMTPRSTVPTRKQLLPKPGLLDPGFGFIVTVFCSSMMCAKK